jgi:hypothetical protein
MDPSLTHGGYDRQRLEPSEACSSMEASLVATAEWPLEHWRSYVQAKGGHGPSLLIENSTK